MTKRIADYELIDHGIENSSYFQGCGTAFTSFEHVTTGIGDNPAEAIEDCLGQIAQGGFDVEPLEKRILVDERWKAFPVKPSVSDQLEENRPEAQFSLDFRAYCGMSSIHETGDKDDMRQQAAELIRRRRNAGYAVQILERGSEWEVLEPENCAMVPDECGIISLEEIEQDDSDDNDCELWYHVSIRWNEDKRDLHRNEDGSLPSFAWPGGYPMYYLCADNGILCPDCANGENGSEANKGAWTDDKQWRIVDSDVHWEGEPLICDHCNKEIESAYGPVEEETEA